MLSESSSTKGADTNHRINFYVTVELTATESYCSHSTVSNSLFIPMRKHKKVHKLEGKNEITYSYPERGKEISNFLINFLMQLGAGLRNSRKVLTISLSPFAFFCIFPTSEEKKPNIPPFLLPL